MTTLTINCALYGPTGVGKTAYLTRVKTGMLLTEHKVSSPNTEHKLSFNYTKDYTIHFNVVESPTEVKQIHCAFLMVDQKELNSPATLLPQVKQIRDACGPVPLMILGTKVDLNLSNTKAFYTSLSRFLHKHGLISSASKHLDSRNSYYDISALSNYNILTPWIHMARVITGDNTLAIITQQ